LLKLATPIRFTYTTRVIEVPKFEVVDVMPPDEMLERLREIPLLKQPDTRPYAEATLSIERFRLSELVSTTKYVQEDLLAVQGMMRAALLPHGYDSLDLTQGRVKFIDHEGVVRRLAPPIVERYEPEGTHRYILDGSHRAETARSLGQEEGEEDPEITVIYVRDGIAYEPYASPNRWDEVRVVQERPADKSEWKNYKDFEDRYRLYRDYEGVLDSVPRGVGDK
jgi:hypothetical protein